MSQPETWRALRRTELASAAASISFQDLGSEGRRFMVVLYIIKDGTAGLPKLTLNNDSGSNYSATQSFYGWYGDTVTTAQRVSGTTFLYMPNLNISANGTSLVVGIISKPVASVQARVMSVASEVQTNVLWVANVGQWNNTSALVSRIDVSSSSANFATGTVAYLFVAK